MDLKTAIWQILRGELYLEMESDEQYKELIDTCQEIGVRTKYLDYDDFSNGYRFVVLDNGDITSLWGDNAVPDDDPNASVIKFSDLIPEFIDVDAASLL